MCLSDKISEWESKRLSKEKINPPCTINKSLSPKLVWMSNSKTRLRFTGSCLKQDKATFTTNNVLDRWSQDLNAKFTLKDCLYGSIEITKYSDPNILIQDME